MVTLNNQYLGMIRQFQDGYFDICYKSSILVYKLPDFEKVANAYKTGTYCITELNEIEEVLSLL